MLHKLDTKKVYFPRQSANGTSATDDAHSGSTDVGGSSTAAGSSQSSTSGHSSSTSLSVTTPPPSSSSSLSASRSRSRSDSTSSRSTSTPHSASSSASDSSDRPPPSSTSTSTHRSVKTLTNSLSQELTSEPPSSTGPTSTTSFTTITTSMDGHLTTITSPVPTGLSTDQGSGGDTSSRTALIGGVTAAAVVILALVLGVIFVVKRGRKRRLGWLEAIRKTRREGMGAGAAGLLDDEFDDDPPSTRYRDDAHNASSIHSGSLKVLSTGSEHSRNPSASTPPATPAPGPYQHHYHYVHARELSGATPGPSNDNGSIFHEEVWPPPARSALTLNTPMELPPTPGFNGEAASPSLSMRLRDSDPFRAVYQHPSAGSSVSLDTTAPHVRAPSVVTMLPPDSPNPLTVVNKD